MKLNLPNRLTLSRIVIVPFLLFFLLPLPDGLIDVIESEKLRGYLFYLNFVIKEFGNYIAAAIFIVAASTDGLDGYIARKRKEVTRFGKFLDPIADKLLITAALIALVQQGQVTAWSATIIISREFVVTGLRMVAAAEGLVIAASSWGKVKTVTQMTAIIAILLKNYPIKLITDFHFDRFIMTVAVLVTVYSGYDYIVKNAQVIHPERE